MGNTYTTKEIQRVILGIIKYIDAFCRKNDITYYLMSGSALGAMRHQGFIPWDDDCDIFMTYDNYQRFLALFEVQADSQKYYLQKENTDEWPLYVSRVCLNGTTMVSDEFKNNMKQRHNVFVDVMCLYAVPDSELAHRVQFYSAILLRVNALAKCKFPNKSFLKRVMLKLSKALVNPITKPILLRIVRKNEGNNTKLVASYFGRARYNTASFPRSYLGKQRYVPFEDTVLPVMERVEDYLEFRYGSRWMDIPSQKTRDLYPIHGSFVDLEKDYTDYMNPSHTEWQY